jgi:hypothetical protein
MTVLDVYILFILPVIVLLMGWGAMKWNDRSIRIVKRAEAAARDRTAGPLQTSP